MGEQLPVTQARAELADLVNRVAYAGERIELTRHGTPILLRRRHCRSRPRAGPR